MKEQIKEMARDIFEPKVAIDGIDLAFAAVHGADMPDSHFMRIAQHLYNEGYRKQSAPFSFGHEKGGEWIQLPCKVGDILYVISQMKDKRILPFINQYEVTSIGIKRKSIVIYHEMDGYIKSFKQTDFGRTIFLTKEEAERAVTDINVGSK
jgi:hypothetical protein